MFLGCLSFTEFPLNIQGTGLLIFAVQYISISLYIFTRYIYISVASRPELRILSLRLNMLCSLRLNLNTVIFKFYIIHVCIRILYYIRLPVWNASRGHKYFLICCTFFMPFYKYSNTFDSTLFYIYVSLLYIHTQMVRFAFCSITYLFAIFSLCLSISTVI